MQRLAFLAAFKNYLKTETIIAKQEVATVIGGS